MCKLLSSEGNMYGKYFVSFWGEVEQSLNELRMKYA